MRWASRQTSCRVRDHIPLEQGLRQSSLTFGRNDLSQRPYSIRTSIKTKQPPRNARPNDVRDHIPLEQGLRHSLRVSDGA